MLSSAQIRLAAPGAGLPRVELTVARMLFRLRLATGSRRSFRARFDRERVKILHLYGTCDAEIAQSRFVIKRVPGLEDSSRNWSIWMTLDHLRIVNFAIADTISQLNRGVIPPGVASTAAVKPSTSVTEKVVAEYERSCDSVLEMVDAAPELKTTVRYAHPWFGPLDAFGWYGLAGVHLGIHRVQIERILEGLQVQPG